MLLAVIEHTVVCQNGHVKQTVVKNSYDNYQNVCNFVTVNRGSFEFTSSSIFKHYTYLFLKCFIVGAGQWRTQEFCSGGSTNSIEDRGQRGRGSGGGSLLVGGSGGSCNLVQEISFHIVKFS